MVTIDSVDTNDHVIPRTILGVLINTSGLLAQPPIEGVVTAVPSHLASVLWQTGELVTGLDVTTSTTSPLLRVAAPSAGAVATFSGQVVQLTGAGPEFSGPVIQVLSIELAADHGGVFVDCVVARSRGPSQAYFLADATLVSVIN